MKEAIAELTLLIYSSRKYHGLEQTLQKYFTFKISLEASYEGQMLTHPQKRRYFTRIPKVRFLKYFLAHTVGQQTKI